MMDIIFILLIFFIVTATFTVEAGLDVELPRPATTTTDDDVQTVLVEIDAADEITVAGRIVDFRRVGAALLAALAGSPNAAVVVRSAPTATNGAFVRVLDQARSVGVIAQIAAPRAGTNLPERPGRIGSASLRFR